MFQIIDTTLREGEQYRDAYFTTENKVQVARALDEFGVEYIEVTNPAASPRSRADCATLCALQLRTSKIVGHIRCCLDDATVAVQVGLKHVNVMIGTSPQMQKFSHGKSLDKISKEAKSVIEFLCSHDVTVRFSGEDAFRTDLQKLVKLYEMVEACGVSRVGIPDTVGCATPDEVERVVSAVRAAVKVDIETHFHNDTGCAVANAYMAIKAGATHINTTVLGIGERNGITPLGGFMARMTVCDREYVLSKYKLTTLASLEALVSSCCNDLAIPFNNCITGSAAFSHKAGIHTKAVLANPQTYEVLRPEDFGVTRHVEVASALSGWNAVMSRARSLGLDIGEGDCKRITKLIKDNADKRNICSKDVDDMLRYMTAQRVGQGQVMQQDMAGIMA